MLSFHGSYGRAFCTRTFKAAIFPPQITPISGGFFIRIHPNTRAIFCAALLIRAGAAVYNKNMIH